MFGAAHIPADCWREICLCFASAHFPIPNRGRYAVLVSLICLLQVSAGFAQCPGESCAQLTVNIAADASQPPGLFNVKIDGSLVATNIGNGGSTRRQHMNAGLHVIGQNGGSQTDLTQYITMIGGDCGPDGTIQLRAGDDRTCTILNLADATPIVPTDQTGYANFLAEAKTDGIGGVSKDGSATYKIPLWVPPGRAGIQPNLSLSYDSRKGNGLVGIGWTLTEFPQITRCRRTFAQDGGAEAITFTDGKDGDRYCLDGQRLVKVGGAPDPASAYGSDGTEYRTEKDSHAKIVSFSPDSFGPTYFRVYLKDGRILTLGGSSDSMLEGQRVKTNETDQGTFVSPPDNFLITPTYSTDYSQHVRYAWSLSRIEDRSGNFLTVHYAGKSDDYGYELWPTGIDYTGWAGSPALAPKRHVQLSYESRPDTRETFVSGLKLVQTQRLKSLWMSCCDASEPIRRYALTYNSGGSYGDRSVLNSIQECGAGPVCKRPTEFRWSPGDFTFTDLDTLVKVPPARVATTVGDPACFPFILVGDFGGNGRDSFEANPGCIGPVTYSTPQIPGPQPRLIDVNSDGIVDKVSLEAVDYQDYPSVLIPVHKIFKYQLYMGTGSGGDYPVTDQGEWYTSIPRPEYWLDLNGDGLPDSLTQGPLLDKLGFPLPLSLGWAFRLTPPGTLTPTYPSLGPYTATSVMDPWGFFGPYDASLPPDLGQSPENPLRSMYFAIDLNGSGRASLLGSDSTIVASNTQVPYSAVSYSNGILYSELVPTYFGERLSVQNPDGSNVNPNGYCDPLLADVNGDGLLDWISVSRAGGINVAINTGNGFAAPITYVVPDLFGRGSSSPSLTCDTHNDTGIRVIDLYQDGRQDLVLMGGYPSYDGQQELLALEWTGNKFNAGVLPISAGSPSYQVPNPGNGSPVKWGPNWGFSQVLDYNGDGLDDILEAVNGTFHVYVQQAQKAAVLTDVIDGFGNSEHFDYAPLSNQSVYRAGLCSYPQFCAKKGWVVSAHTVNTGSGVVQSTSYTYQDGRYDLSGRGWIGFAQIRATDADRQTTTTTTYDNSTRVGTAYPCAQIPSRIVTDVDDGDHRVQTSMTCRTVTEFGGNVYFAYQDSWDKKQWDASGTSNLVLLSEILGHDAEDLYGNTVQHDTSVYHIENSQPTGRPEEVQTSSSYDNFDSTWLVGQLRHVKQTAVTRTGATATTETAYEYGPDNGLVAKIVREPEERTRVGEDRSDFYLESDIERNSYGLPVAISLIGSGQTRKSLFQYDDSEGIFVQSTTDALGHSRQFEHYSPTGAVTQRVDENGLATKFRYDGFGRVRFIQNPDSTFVDFHYVTDSTGSPKTAVQNIFGGVAATIFDSDRREITRISIRSGNWTSVETGYDKLGRLASVSLPHWVSAQPALTHFGYDDLDRLQYLQHPYPAVRRFQYSGLRTKVQDENSNYSFYTADEANRIVASGLIGSKDIGTSFSYTPLGLLDRVTDYFGRVTSLEYDKLGRRTVLRDLDTGLTTTHYNAFDEVKDEIDGAGRQTLYVYDLLGRPTTVTTTDGTTRFTWDTSPGGIGKLASATSPDDVTSAYSYDSLSRVKQMTSILGSRQYSFEYSYDGLGRLAAIKYPQAAKDAGPTIALNYEQNHRRVQSISDLSHKITYWTAGLRNARGQLRSETFGNGIVTALGYYDGELTGWLSALATTKGSTPIQCFGYTFDGVGNVLGRDSANGSDCTGDPVKESSTLDGFDRIKTWTAPDWSSAQATYDYDEVGNIENQSGTLKYNYGGGSAGVHAVTEVTSGAVDWKYAYDPAGSQVAGPDRNVQYTAFNLPSRIRTKDHDLVFQYDAFQQRSLKQDHKHGDTSYVGDLFEERNIYHWWGKTREYIFYLPGPYGVFGEILRRKNADQTFYFHPDLLGSITAVSDEKGNIVERYAYSPFWRAQACHVKSRQPGH